MARIKERQCYRQVKLCIASRQGHGRWGIVLGLRLWPHGQANADLGSIFKIHYVPKEIRWFSTLPTSFFLSPCFLVVVRLESKAPTYVLRASSTLELTPGLLPSQGKKFLLAIAFLRQALQTTLEWRRYWNPEPIPRYYRQHYINTMSVNIDAAISEAPIY